MLHSSVPFLLHFVNLWDARVRRAGKARQVHLEQSVVWRGHAWGQSVMYGVRVKTINGVLGVRVRAIGMYGVRWKERPVCWVNLYCLSFIMEPSNNSDVTPQDLESGTRTFCPSWPRKRNPWNSIYCFHFGQFLLLLAFAYMAYMALYHVIYCEKMAE